MSHILQPQALSTPNDQQKSKAVVQHKFSSNGSLIFEAIGLPGLTRQAIIDVAKEVDSMTAEYKIY